MKIEIIGPSGVGKSYFLKDFKQNNIKKNKIKYFLSFKFFKHFIYTSILNFNQTILKSKNLSTYNKIKLFIKKEKYLFFFNNNSLFKYYKNKNNTYIDEGLIGYFVNLMEELSNIEKDLENYLKYATNIPDKLILLIPEDKKTLFENMNKRKRWPRRDLGEAYFNDLINRQLKILKVIEQKKFNFKIEVIKK